MSKKSWSHWRLRTAYTPISGGEITARKSRDTAPLPNSLGSLKDQHRTPVLLIPD